MRAHDFSGVSSAGRTPDGAVIIRQYLIPRNPENRLYKLHQRANPNQKSGLIPLVGNSQTMGAFLDKPRTEKSNESGQGAGLRYGVAAMQGWRVDMEDAHTARLGVALAVPWTGWSFFAIFDGHAGGKVAKYCAGNLLESIWSTCEMQQLEHCLPLVKLDNKQVKLVTKAIKQGFLNLDEQMRRFPELNGENERSGCTAVCAVVSPSHVFIGNLGDSRALVSRNGQVHLATEDHKPYVQVERDRIVNAGGSVMLERVNGSLAVSRALGDYEYKNATGLGASDQMVSPEPDVEIVKRDLLQTGKDAFLLLACDGVFDVMTNGELCDFVRNRLRITNRLELICNQILDSCLSKGSKDNMSVILVTFAGASRTNEGNKEKELEMIMREQISDILNGRDGAIDPECVDVDYILRILTAGESKMPPGVQVQSLRPLVQSILESIRSDSISISQCSTGAGQCSDASQTAGQCDDTTLTCTCSPIATSLAPVARSPRRGQSCPRCCGVSPPTASLSPRRSPLPEAQALDNLPSAM